MSRKNYRGYIDYIFNREQYKILKSQAKEMNMDIEEYFECILKMNHCRDGIILEEAQLRNLTNDFTEIPDEDDLRVLIGSIKNLIYNLHQERNYFEIILKAAQNTDK